MLYVTSNVSMNARFQVEDVFVITGRGSVALGDILEGSLRVGMFTQPLDANGETKPLKITGVEIADRRLKGDAKVGLLFDSIAEKETLRHALPDDGILLIFDNLSEANAQN
jgi:translation elongation factor EF-Tu-like GTPase